MTAIPGIQRGASPAQRSASPIAGMLPVMNPEDIEDGLEDVDDGNPMPVTELDGATSWSSMEHLLEHAVLAELTQEAWFGRGQLIDILHSSVDAFGHDVVLECGRIIRHVQFKARRLDATTSTYKINTRLSQRPSGCIVWLGWSRLPSSNRVSIQYRWFGGPPGKPLPDFGEVVAKHAKGNALGVKHERPGIRVVTLGRFERVRDAADLLGRLFGPSGLLEAL